LSRQRLQSGISLIETLVGMAIVIVALAMGLPSFSTYMQNTQIRNAAESIQNGLSMARAEAARRNTVVQFVLGSGSSWTVGCATVDGTNCPASIQARSSSEGSSNATVTTSQVVTSTGTAAATATFTTTLSFNGFGKASTLPPGNSALFDISNSSGGGTCTTMRCLRVVVTAGGQIRMCDPKLTLTNAGNPQAC
jgi:type IV fimbrial biogenesis protein FimT